MRLVKSKQASKQPAEYFRSASVYVLRGVTREAVTSSWYSRGIFKRILGHGRHGILVHRDFSARIRPGERAEKTRSPRQY